MDKVLMAQEWRDYEGTWTEFLQEHCLYYDCVKCNYFTRNMRDAPIEKRRKYKTAKQRKEEIAEYHRLYYQRHKKKIKEYNRLYKQRHRKEIREKQRRRRKLEKAT